MMNWPIRPHEEVKADSGCQGGCQPLIWAAVAVNRDRRKPRYINGF
jgi:hypothetical protein